MTLWSRKPFGQGLKNDFDYPLSAKYDESDAMVLCDNVLVPWEKVFVHANTEKSRGIYVETAMRWAIISPTSGSGPSCSC